MTQWLSASEAYAAGWPLNIETDSKNDKLVLTD